MLWDASRRASHPRLTRNLHPQQHEAGSIASITLASARLRADGPRVNTAGNFASPCREVDASLEMPHPYLQSPLRSSTLSQHILRSNMAKKTSNPATNGQSVQGYFREIFRQHPHLLKGAATTNSTSAG